MAEYNAEINQNKDGYFNSSIVPRITVTGNDDKAMHDEAISKFLAHPGVKSGDRLIHTIDGEEVILVTKP